MKNISNVLMITALTLSLFGSSLLATNTLEFKDFFVEPQTLVPLTVYDYMNGAYNGFPMRIHKSGISDGSIFYTFMVQDSPSSARKQRFAHTDMSGNLISEGFVTTQHTLYEGFGSLAIDPITGSPIFAWHTGSFESQHEIFNSYFARYTKSPDLNTLGPPYILSNNELRNPADQHEFIWPVIHIDDSPFEGKKRMYVFQQNRARSFQQSQTGMRDVPSSAILLSTADFDANDPDFMDEIVWTERLIPYFQAIHEWKDNYIGGGQGHVIARAHTSYAVSGNMVAIAGTLSGYHESWSDMDEHNFFVVFSDDYGETFVNHGFLIENKKEADFRPMFDPIGISDITNPKTLEDIDKYNEFFAEKSHWSMSPAVLRNTTMTFDSMGRLHFPTVFQARYRVGIYRNSLPLKHMINTFVFDHTTGSLEVKYVYPKPHVSMSNTIPFTWDLDNDEYIDIVTDDEGKLILYPAVHPYFFPSFDANDTSMFNQMRMTLENDGLIAMMWMDSSKAELHSASGNSSEIYPDFYQTSEIMISISIDSGNSWSEPLSINKNTHPEISFVPGSVPAYIYPADLIFRVDEHTVRLYFMYVDNLEWGDNVGFGQSEGASIRFTAIDLNIENITNISDTFLPVPQALLYQNYPNPFNPSTTISFSVGTDAFVLSASSQQGTHIRIDIYNIRGQKVRTLVNESYPPGKHTVEWNGKNESGNKVGSGVYLYRMTAGESVSVRRMVLLK